MGSTSLLIKDTGGWGGGGGQTWDDWSEDIFMLLVVMSASLGDD